MERQANNNIKAQDEKLKMLAIAESNVHLMNINEDPILTGYVRHILKQGDNKVGSKVDQGFKIGGLGVGDEHCVLSM